METEKKESGWIELLRFGIIALVIAGAIRLWIADPFVVSGPSMFPTFENGNYLIVDEISYKLGNPQRDDVVVFQYPGDPKNNPARNFILRYFDPGKYFIKRIIGLPGETIDINGSVITITNKAHPSGFKLDQPFIKDPTLTDNMHVVLTDDEYFVMGDNRNASSDSRFWGPVKRNFLTGRVFLRLLPLNSLGILPGAYKQTE